jgi:hypothetical protein
VTLAAIIGQERDQPAHPLNVNRIENVTLAPPGAEQLCPLQVRQMMRQR